MKKMKILIIDDEDAFTVMLRMNLEATGGFQVETEARSDKALDTALRFEPDFILMDVVMPEKEGPEVTMEIHASEKLAKVPIAYLTATITPAEAESLGGSIGGHPLLAKPSSVGEILHTIRQHT